MQESFNLFLKEAIYDPYLADKYKEGIESKGAKGQVPERPFIIWPRDELQERLCGGQYDCQGFLSRDSFAWSEFGDTPWSSRMIASTFGKLGEIDWVNAVDLSVSPVEHKKLLDQYGPLKVGIEFYFGIHYL